MAEERQHLRRGQTPDLILDVARQNIRRGREPSLAYPRAAGAMLSRARDRLAERAETNMQATLEALPHSPATVVTPMAPVFVAVDGLSSSAAAPAAERLEVLLRERFPQRAATVVVTAWEAGEVVVRPPGAVVATGPAAVAPSVTTGGVEAHVNALAAVLREGVRLQGAALALIAAEPHDDATDWLGTFLAPVLEDGFDFVSPAYLRHKADAAINTGIVYPLTRTLYGRRLRQPLGGEAAVSLALARRLLDETDWRRDPASAGSDAWLVARVLTGDARVCQAWLGARPRPQVQPEDVSQTLARVLGMVFREMERHADRWQRVSGSVPVQSFGAAGLLEGGPQPPVERFVETFQLGQRELAPIWGLVLPPSTGMALHRAASLGVDRFRIDDVTWAHIVYDFAVAHYARLVERRQLLLSMTPLYLGWVASFTDETRALDAAATEARVEQLCATFEREKRYLISRWRWPDGFNP
jgi:hypothetical protein